ncbi:hypothetical protein ACH5RR_039155 [Cinchona calisaya]|uniref:S-protein homolog n=1 Tax=Cinchona calisaya TaxID=153742 RepID=A0ABD2Y0W1_9GENT
MASKKISQPIPMSSIVSKKRWNGASCSIYTIARVLIQLSFLQLIAMLLIIPSSAEAKLAKKKDIYITNNHTNILTVRCFSFNDEIPRRHLRPNETFNFTVTHNIIFPSLSMYNCSTNMGVFIAYRYDYKCSDESVKSCDWRFDERRTYHYINETQTWEAYDYNPNYESLGRGGVVKGYFTN